MGTDIHMFVEKQNEWGEWEALSGKNALIEDYRSWAKSHREKGNEEDALRLEKDANDIESGAKILEQRERYGYDDAGEYYAPFTYEGWLYDGRNYNLFAILADVRNGRGFAGVETGEGFNPIAPVKGMPEDMSSYIQDRNYDDYYGHSYFTIRELLDYDWYQETVQYGIVGEDQYQKWKEKGKPESWSGGVSGRMVVHLSNDEMEDLIHGRYPREEGKSYHTRVSWTEPYYESVGHFYTECLSRLEELADGDLDSVRIVFWFDS